MKAGLEVRLSECLSGVTFRELAHAMSDYVESGGTVDQQPETREPWCERYDYHYDLRIRMEGKLVYVETVFPDWEDDPSVLVVNVHDA